MQQDAPLGPELVTSAARTTKTSRPAEVHQIIAADLVSREALLKFGKVTRGNPPWIHATQRGYMSQVHT